MNDKKIFLRKVQKKDWEYFKVWWKDKYLIALTTGDFHEYTEKDMYNWFLNMIHGISSFNFIVSNEERVVIGHTGFEIKGSKAEYNVMLGKDFVNKGYGVLIHKKVLNIAFRKFELDKVFLKVRPENLRAIKSYLKAGFNKTGERKYKNINNPISVIMEIKNTD